VKNVEDGRYVLITAAAEDVLGVVATKRSADSVRRPDPRSPRARPKSNPGFCGPAKSAVEEALGEYATAPRVFHDQDAGDL